MSELRPLSADIEPAERRSESEPESPERNETRSPWVFLLCAMLVWTLGNTLISVIIRQLFPDHRCPSSIERVKYAWEERTREMRHQEYLEAKKKGVTEEQARDMLVEGKMRTVIDGHNDLPYLIRFLYGNQIYDGTFNFTHLPGHVDGNRLVNSNVRGTFWSIFVECPKSDFDENGVEFGDAIYAESVTRTFQQVDLVKRLMYQNRDTLASTYSTRGFDMEFLNAVRCWFEPGGSKSEIDTCLFQEIFPAKPVPHYYGDDDSRFVANCVGLAAEGWVVSVMGAEGLHQIGNSVANLRLLYELGVRYMTLTHGCNNRYADSATAPGGPKWGGLSEEGREIVREMNRLGMLVDLSHVSADVMRDVLGGVSKAPVMFSHSSAFALCPHPRNVPDDVLHLVKKNNGVVMVNFYPEFVSCGPGKVPANATLEMVVDHIEYIGKLIGWEHVGIGSDFDGIDSVPKGLEDVSKFPDLTVELLKRGVKAIDVVKVMGLNILRVWWAVELLGEQMYQEGILPMEDKLPKRKFNFIEKPKWAGTKELGMVRDELK